MRVFRHAFYVTLIFLLQGCPDPKLCNDSLGRSRLQDTHWAPPSGTSPVIVLSLDTEPTKRSQVFEAGLKGLGYEYYLLGASKSKAGIEYPKKSGSFRELLWGYRTSRYLDRLGEIAGQNPNAIVVLTDGNDVLFAQGPAQLEARFRNFNKDIVLSGTVYCCNISPMKYVRRLALELGVLNSLDDPRIFSTDPEMVTAVRPLRNLLASKGADWDYGDEPLLLWTPEAKEILGMLKAVPLTPQGKYRYINAGGIIGYAGALKTAIEEQQKLTTTPAGLDLGPPTERDDEHVWHIWYGLQKGYKDGSAKAIIDYEQKIFKVTYEIEDLDGLLRYLYDDFSQLPNFKPFEFSWDPDNQPLIYHCASCFKNQMSSFRHQIINQVPNYRRMLDDDLLEFIDKC